MSQSSSPAMDVMPHVIIPDKVVPLGPQFSKLPEELLIEIVKYTVGFNPTAMTIARRDKINLVCKTFSRLSNHIFYSLQIFNPSADVFRRVFTPPTIFFFPPVAFRNLVRRMKITIEITDHFRGEFIKTAPRFFMHCPGATRLLELTNDIDGFDNLQLLELVVLTDYKFPDRIEETLAILRRSAFGLDATRIYMLAVHSGGQSAPYHDKVVDAILGQ